MIRVIVADDQALVRRGFASILDSIAGITVVGEAEHGADAVAIAIRERPDVVLMDVRMPHMDGLEATRRITSDAALRDVRIIILTTFDLDEYVHDALCAGASGFLLKDARPDELVSAIRAVAAGDAVVAPRVTRRLLDMYATRLPRADEPGPTPGDPRLADLTPRELDVLRAVARGMSNGEIADELVVAEATVKTHVGRILAKLGVRDRVQAVIVAYQAGLAGP